MKPSPPRRAASSGAQTVTGGGTTCEPSTHAALGLAWTRCRQQRGTGTLPDTK